MDTYAENLKISFEDSVDEKLSMQSKVVNTVNAICEFTQKIKSVKNRRQSRQVLLQLKKFKNEQSQEMLVSSSDSDDDFCDDEADGDEDVEAYRQISFRVQPEQKVSSDESSLLYRFKPCKSYITDEALQYELVLD